MVSLLLLAVGLFARHALPVIMNTNRIVEKRDIRKANIEMLLRHTYETQCFANFLLLWHITILPFYLFKDF